MKNRAEQPIYKDGYLDTFLGRFDTILQLLVRFPDFY
jgi:hypothetical protein